MPRYRTVFLLFCFFIVTFILYASTLKYGFVLDDFDLIVNNSYIKNLTLLPRLFLVNAYHFSSSQSSNYYRPLQLVSYVFEYHFWQLNPSYYHLVNILLQTINGFLVSILILKLFSSFRLALFAGLLFCVHPIHVSVVSYIAGRADLLVTFFMLLSLLKFYDYLKMEKLGAFVQSFVFFGLALLSRENALLLPFFLIILAFGCGGKKEKLFLPLSGFLILAAFYIYVRFLLFNRIAMLSPEIKLFSFPLELVNLANILKEYIALFVFPWPLHPMRTVPFVENLTFGNVFWTSCLFGFLSLLLVWTFAKKERMFSFGILWFMCGFLPLIRMMYLFPRFGAVVAESWMYLPSIGVFLILGRFLLVKKNGWALVIFISLFCYFSALTILNNRCWKDNLTLYKYILKTSPNNTNIRLNLANIYFDNGLYDLALREFNTILKKEQTAWDVYLGLGNVYYAKGELERAAYFYNQAILFNAKCSQAYYNKGLISIKQSKDNEARQLFVKALEINQDYWPAYLALGDWCLRNGLYREALKMYEKAGQLNPNEQVHSKIGITLVQLEEYQKAAIIFEDILKSNPRFVNVMKMLGLCYGQMGRFDDAINTWSQVLEINQSDGEAKRDIDKAKLLKNSAHIKD